MGKQTGKKKKQIGDKYREAISKRRQGGVGSSSYDKDHVIFITMSQALKEEGNKLFQSRDVEGAMLKYEKALKLLPRNHIDVSYLRSNMAACYMQMGLSEYPQAIHECNLALEVTPKYSKALLKRARCYEALHRLDLALRDVNAVLNLEPRNIMALEISERLTKALMMQGSKEDDAEIKLPLDFVELPSSLLPQERPKEKNRKMKNNQKTKETIDEKKAHETVEEKADEIIVEEEKADETVEEKKADEIIVEEEKADETVEEKKADEIIVEEEKADETVEEKKPEDKLVVEEKINRTQEETPMKSVKLVFGDDIRWAQVPIDCTLLQLREVIQDRFPTCTAVLIKYRDEEGDLVTITADEELRLAETSKESQGSVRFYIFEVNPEQDPFYGRFKNDEDSKCKVEENSYVLRAKEMKISSCIDDWLIHFAQLFINHVGFESGPYLDLHDLGMKLYSEAVEETVTSEEAQGLFESAAEKFHEMAALALFYWGNVIMSRARKKVYFTDGVSKVSLSEQIKAAYDWVEKAYVEAGNKYQMAVKIKPDFYEGYLALGQQQFEQAKLSWHYAVSSNVDPKTWPCTKVIHLYNNAEDNMETGMRMWEEWEKQHTAELSKSSDVETPLQKMGLDGLIKDISADEAAEQAKNMRSHINLLWGTMLYERSILEFKMGLPSWHECLEVAVEKFELAGASATDIAVMIKNHCSSNNAHEGLGFKIEEIVQAWNEMYEARKLLTGVPSFRLEPLFRRRVSKIYHVLEQA
ncbi:protein PHOX1-like isoform X1 [Cucurbita maxima]|uniref:Protein PHOX1-like isoform X1 n=1 Tax=Cucurbita maxima TaxID=3661 RepID=A0A6J1JJD6_CUCMA|nr:protein PHOX1-like isoform X1 [Cucurbita maxima]XP_022987619.1 protein PHOX1-like isoform X1 [Cucurbita maxima]